MLTFYPNFPSSNALVILNRSQGSNLSNLSCLTSDQGRKKEPQTPFHGPSHRNSTCYHYDELAPTWTVPLLIVGVATSVVHERGGNCPFFKGITMAPRTSLEVEPGLTGGLQAQQRA